MYIPGEWFIQADTSLVTAAIRSPKIVVMFFWLPHWFLYALLLCSNRLKISIRLVPTNPFYSGVLICSSRMRGGDDHATENGSCIE